jgi:protein-tyrosine-phosphatase
MCDLGIDISGNTTKPLTRFARSRFDRVVTLCDKVREICPEFPGEPIAAHWSIADPATEGDTDEETLPAFRRVAEEVEWRVDLLIADLTVRPTERKHHAS